MEPSTPPSGETAPEQPTKKFKLTKKRLTYVGIGVGVAALVVGVGYFLDWYKFRPGARPAYAQAYSLVPDKISKSATVVISLPAGMNRDAARPNISFTPEVKGELLTQGTERQLIFQPSKPLRAGKYYTVTLKTNDGTIGKDFLVEEDPEVAAIFPKSDSEAHEQSNITVVFNRPMVPLTTLDVLDTKDIPLSIEPLTKGRYKWIGTKTVQFIPEDRLRRSSNYTVKVAANAVSMDGLKVKPTEARFVTRQLRYAHISGGQYPIVYNQPITISFNQPVDLERTKKEISVFNTSSNKPVDIIIEFGKQSKYNEQKKKYEDVDDPTRLEVYQKRDSHGRNKLWDFTNSYHLTIKNGYPQEGDVDLNEAREAYFRVTDIIAGVYAESKRSNQAAPDFFDPQGQLVVDFYEPINIRASDIRAPHLKNITYGEKCDEDGASENREDCAKVPDEEQLIFHFDESKLNFNQEIPIEFRRVVNKESFRINTATITRSARVIPRFEIFRTVPESATTSASITGLAVCSNSPLAVPDKKEVNDFIKVNPVYEYKGWQASFRVPQKNSYDRYKCESGEFETTINYGLMPETQYKIDLSLRDHFDQTANKFVSFKTELMPGKFLNFYHFQKDYNVTVPSRTELTYATENMEFVDLDICELPAEAMLEQLINGPEATDTPGTIAGCVRRVTKRLDLPKRFWIKNFFTLDLKDHIENPLGHFILTFSHPNYTNDNSYVKQQIFERTFLTVTKLSVVEKKIEVWDKSNNSEEYKLGDARRRKLSNLYWVADLTTLDPVRGARVDLYTGEADRNSGSRKIELTKASNVITNEQGVARSAPLSEMRATIVSKDADSAIVFDETKFGYYTETAGARTRMYIYTDRPLYRPGHEVQIKGLYRFGYDGQYEITRDKPVNLRVIDARQKEILSKEIPVSEFGTFAVSTTLPADAPLGTYRIQVDDRGYGYFEVEEYVGAPFKLDAKVDREEYIAGDTFNLSLDASYYFGAPVEGGTVEYSVVSQNYYFDKYQGDEYFSFGNGWYDCYYSCSYGDKFVLRGSADIDRRGHAAISHKLDLAKWFPKEADRMSKIMVVYLTAKNSTGQSVSTQKSFIVHAGEYYLGLRADDSFISKGQPVNLKMKSANTEGKATRARNVSVSYNRIRWVNNKRQGVDGAYYYTWERELEKVHETSADTDGDGNWSDSFTPQKEGEYEVIARGTDKRGNVIRTTYTFYVYGEPLAEFEEDIVRPTNDTTLELVPEKTSVETGGRASFIIKSPYQKAKALIAIERGDVYRYEIVDINQRLYRYSFPITEQYIPNVYASVVLLSSKPEVKYGRLSFGVNTKEKTLQVSVKANKDHYLPGEEVTLTFEAKDSRGRPVETEFSAAVVDVSVLALKGNPKKNPVAFFYDGFPLTVSTLSNVKNILFKVDIPVGAKGGGGGEPSDLARRKRGEFRDTAHWEATIKTDKNGRARVSFKLPDNLTTWQVETVGITKNTYLGIFYNDFVARKELMTVPLQPRFILPGDIFSVGAKVFNQTNNRQRLTVSFKSDSLELLDKRSELTVTIPKGETQTFYFKVKAPANQIDGTHVFAVSAKNSAYEDTVEQRIPIKRNDTYETTATANYTREAVSSETLFIPGNVAPDKGTLTVKSSATLAVFLSDALKYMLEFPYNSCEQIGSRLKTIAVLKRASKAPNLEAAFPVTEIQWSDGRKYPVDEFVRLGINELYEYQNDDGGFMYYKRNAIRRYEPYYNRYSSPYLSMHIASVWRALNDAGYEMDDERGRRLFNYLNIEGASALYHSKPEHDNYTIVIARAISHLREYGSMDRQIIKRIREIAQNKTFLHDKSSNTALGTLALLLADEQKIFGKSLTNRVVDTLENRIEIDARGAYLAPNNNLLWEYYETPVKNTALLLKVLTHDKRDNQVLDRILRWLLASRAKDGSWGSTPNTLEVIDAMTDYLNANRETESDFTLATSVDREVKRTFRFATSTVLAQDMFTLPVKDLPRDRLVPVEFKKEQRNKLKNTLYYDLALRYYLPVDATPPRDEGFAVTRQVFHVDDIDGKRPVNSGRVGDVLRVHTELVVPRSRNYVALEDFIPAGAEIVNLNFATEDQLLSQKLAGRNAEEEQWQYNEPRRFETLYPSVQESRDDRVYAAFERLDPGTYAFDYHIRLLVPGTFQHLPAVISENYFPENFGRTGGSLFTIEP